MNWSFILTNALVNGLGLSLVLVIIMIISASFAPDMWVGDYPPDIREKFGPMSTRAARLRPLVAVVFFIPVMAIPLLGLYALSSKLGPMPFLPALVYSSAVLLVFNVFDLLVLDWLVFCTIQPSRMVLAGTEGMPGYRDYRFHFVGFLKGLAFCSVGGIVIASIWSVLQPVLA